MPRCTHAHQSTFIYWRCAKESGHQGAHEPIGAYAQTDHSPRVPPRQCDAHAPDGERCARHIGHAGKHSTYGVYQMSVVTRDSFAQTDHLASPRHEESAHVGHSGDSRTCTGRHINLLEPEPERIDPFDVAHHLSLLCRFGGGVRQFYSVAQHSVLVSMLVPAEHAMWGLLHDAPEAYIVDLPRPLKHSGQLREYLTIERRMMDAVCDRFGLPRAEPRQVDWADDVLLLTEQRDLRSAWEGDEGRGYKPSRAGLAPLPGRLVSWSPWEAREAFLARYTQLGGTYERPDWANVHEGDHQAFLGRLSAQAERAIRP